MPDDESGTDDDKVDATTDVTVDSDEVSGYGLSLNTGLNVKFNPIDDWIEHSWEQNYGRKDGSIDQGDYDPHHHNP